MEDFRVVPTNHKFIRMAQRSVLRNDILVVLEYPDRHCPGIHRTVGEDCASVRRGYVSYFHVKVVAHVRDDMGRNRRAVSAPKVANIAGEIQQRSGMVVVIVKEQKGLKSADSGRIRPAH